VTRFLTAPVLYALAGLSLLLLVATGVQSWRLKSCHVDKAEQSTALMAASESLRAADKALRAQNEAHAAAVAAEEAARRHAETAAEAAKRETARLAKEAADRAEDFERRLLIAQRRPECKTLLDTDVRQTCGF
jgi:tryptophan 2,3-dioxygenase